MSFSGLALSLLIGASLGFFGGGGSILTVPLLVYVFGLEPKIAIASSLAIVAAASSVGAIRHWRVGNLRIRTATIFGVSGVVGAYAGGRTSALVDGGVLLLLFASMMILTSLAMWRGRRDLPSSEVHAGADQWKLALQGLVVGCFTGLVGAGGGFLIVPALVLWAGLPMPAAVGTSLFIIVLNSVAGFLGYAAHVSVDVTLIVAVSACAIAGTFAGAGLAQRVDPASLRRAFAVFVLAMGAAVLIREGRLVIETAGPAMPETLPQLVFVAIVLIAGIAAGRVSRGAGAEGVPEQSFRQGEGI